MKEYLTKHIGKKTSLVVAGGAKESVVQGTIKEIVGDVVVLDGEDGEIAIALNMIAVAQPAPNERPGKSMGFR